VPGHGCGSSLLGFVYALRFLRFLVFVGLGFSVFGSVSELELELELGLVLYSAFSKFRWKLEDTSY